jgi:hypothetical protein
MPFSGTQQNLPRIASYQQDTGDFCIFLVHPHHGADAKKIYLLAIREFFQL